MLSRRLRDLKVETHLSRNPISFSIKGDKATSNIKWEGSKTRTKANTHMVSTKKQEIILEKSILNTKYTKFNKELLPKISKRYKSEPKDGWRQMI